MRPVAHHRPGRPRPDDDAERGAVLIVVSIFLVVLIAATALTVDIGRVSSRRRDLQAVADAVSLDLSRDLGGRTASTILADPAWAAAIADSRSRNDFDPTASRTLAVGIGTFDAQSDVFTPSSPGDVPTAVEVAATDVIQFEFAPGSRATTRTAVAAQTPTGGFSIGSIGVAITSSQSALLDSLIGQGLGVTGIGYDGLAGAQVQLPLLAEALGLSVGSPTDLLTTQLTLVQLISAEAQALRLGGDLVQAQLLDGVVGALPDPTLPITLGQLMDIEAGGEAAAATVGIDALRLLTATALVANGTNLLSISNLSLVAPGLAGTASLQVIEPPQFVFGPAGATVSTAQVKLSTALTLGGTIATGVTVSGTAAVGLQVANGTGTIAAVGCGPPQSLTIGVATSLATASINLMATVQALVPVANLDVGLATTRSPASGSVAFTIPPDAFGQSKRYDPGTGIGLTGATVITDNSTLLSSSLLPLGTLVNTTLSTVLDPTLAALDQWVTSTIDPVLGLSVAAADVTPLAATCAGPQLQA